MKGHHLKLMHVGLLTYVGYLHFKIALCLNLGQMCDVEHLDSLSEMISSATYRARWRIHHQ